MKLRLIFIMLSLLIIGCAGVKPYQKEYLLSPLLDDEKLQNLNSEFRGSFLSSYEKLSNSGAGGSGGSSCPTCGG